LDEILEYGQRVQREKADPQMGLFGSAGDAPSINLPPLPEIEEWDEKHLLANEKEALGFYITGHPLNRYSSIIDKFATADTLTLKEKQDNTGVRLAGIIRNIKTITTKRGDLMAFVTVEDLNGSFEMTVFSSLYTEVHHLLSADNAVLVDGQVQKEENTVKLLANHIVPIQKAEEIWTVSIHINLDTANTGRDQLESLHQVVKNHSGTCDVFLHIKAPEMAEAIIALPEQFQLHPSGELRKEINACMGYHAYESICSKAGSYQQPKRSYYGK
jgi:DNA polymerase-3 subunit alpha